MHQIELAAATIVVQTEEIIFDNVGHAHKDVGQSSVRNTCAMKIVQARLVQ